MPSIEENNMLHGEEMKKKIAEAPDHVVGQNFKMWRGILRDMLYDVPLRKRDIVYLEEMETFFKHGNLEQQ